MIRILLALLLLGGVAQARPTPPPPNPATGYIIGPCDKLVGGCLSAWSVVQVMRGAYQGSPLMTLYRSSDGATTNITNVPGSPLVDIGAIHNFCDTGGACYVEYLYDQGTASSSGDCGGAVGNTLCNTTVGRMPLLVWDDNGLPRMNFFQYYAGLVGTTNKLGGHLDNNSPTGLPVGSASSTMFALANNFKPSMCCESWGYSADAPNDTGGRTFYIGLQNYNSPTKPIFGFNWEAYLYSYGTFPSTGYTKYAGLIKYNGTTNEATARILPLNGYVSGSAAAQGAYSTYAAAPSFTVNTGLGNPVKIHMGAGSDAGNYGGNLSSALIANYATSSAEDSLVLAALADVGAPAKPAPCGPQAASALSATKPNTTTANIPANYQPLPHLNVQRAVFAVSTSLVNSAYNGPILQARRSDNGNTKDIFAAGCGLDIQDVTNFCSGTTCTVPVVYDQTAHTAGFRNPYPATQPALNITGVNSLPALGFSSVSSFTTTASGSAGVLTVTATGGTINAGDIITGSGVPSAAIITGQLTGTPGGTGTYSVPGLGTVSSETVTVDPTPWMMTDGGIWSNDCGCMTTAGGLWQNQTVEAVFFSGSGTLTNGSILQMVNGGWCFGNGTTNTLQYCHNSGATDLAYSGTFSLAQAHFGYATTDASSPQNLTVNQDNGVAATGTTTQTSALYSGTYYILGNALNNQVFKGQITYAAVFTDNEVANTTDCVSGTACTVDIYNWAHALWGTP